MLTILLTIVLILSMAIIVISCVYTLVRCESKKRNTFIAVLIFGFIGILGYLFEINSSVTEEAFLGKRIMYMGSFFSIALLLLFVINYCDIKIKKWVTAFILTTPLCLLAIMWTTGLHGLYYKSYSIDTSGPIVYLDKESGFLHLLGHAWIFICIAVTIIILIAEYKKGDSVRKKRLVIPIVSTILCLTSNAVYLANPFDLHINYGPIAIAVTCLLFFINILRYDMFDIVPRASETALSFMSDALIIIDTNNTLLDANPSAHLLFPSMNSLKKYSNVSMVDNWPQELVNVSSYKSNESIDFSLNDEKYFNADINPIMSNHGEQLGSVILVHDITESVILSRELEKMAYFDMLTGILNRRRFIDLASIQLDRVRRSENDSYIIIFDLDHFKLVNDEFGHLVGDKVLSTVAARIKDAIRPYDLFGRYGGEEFILFIFDIDKEGIFNLTERLRSVIGDKIMRIDNVDISITASFGCASANKTDTLEAIFQLADNALYQAKNEGRNKIVILDK